MLEINHKRLKVGKFSGLIRSLAKVKYVEG